ncbi:MAG TPA: RtcB family protein [Polyangiaceae bacterium]|nr:RtcB family protein [Polyangiaceae bacterium]
MFRVIHEPERGQRVPVRLWARDASPDTVRQLQRLASQPYVTEFVAGMADAHVSEGVAVGSVFATERTVVPRALGGDLGCGMSARRIAVDPDALDRRALQTLVRDLERAIPTGDATHTGRGVSVPEALLTAPLSTGALEHAREALSRRHLGTLGGGNHFIEIDRDADGGLWLLVHSGSRGLGAAIAHHHAQAAAAGAPSGDLPGLDVESASGAAYMRDLAWALDFARANRRSLEARALEVIGNMLAVRLNAEDGIDVHHNFVAQEDWCGRELFIHRKGAVAVPPGALALVPGSMGTASYVVEGLGAADSFGSCSHGAGRVMSRKEARARVHPRALASSMRRVVYPEHLARQLVEEAPAAYRDIGEVLDEQKDLVHRRVRLEPVAVLKG